MCDVSHVFILRGGRANTYCQHITTDDGTPPPFITHHRILADLMSNYCKAPQCKCGGRSHRGSTLALPHPSITALTLARRSAASVPPLDKLFSSGHGLIVYIRFRAKYSGHYSGCGTIEDPTAVAGLVTMLKVGQDTGEPNDGSLTTYHVALLAAPSPSARVSRVASAGAGSGPRD